jgi:hypothetical protein
MALASLRVAGFIYAALAADTGVGGVAHAALTGGRIYRDMVPQSVTTYPAIVIQNLSATPVAANGAYRVLSSDLWLVKVIGQGESQAPITTIGDRVDTVLQRLSGTSGGAYVPPLNLESSLAYSELEGSKRWSYLDLTYRAFPHAA